MTRKGGKGMKYSDGKILVGEYEINRIAAIPECEPFQTGSHVIAVSESLSQLVNQSTAMSGFKTSYAFLKSGFPWESRTHGSFLDAGENSVVIAEPSAHSV